MRPQGVLPKAWARLQAGLRRRDVSVTRFSSTNELLPHLGRLLEHLHVDVVLDVGANRGQTVRELREIGYRGRIVSFEPTPDLFARLEREHGADPLWTGRGIALGEEATELVLHRYEQDTMNSFLRASDLGRSRFAALAADRVGEVRVPVRRLDEVWDEVVPAGRVFLKIDTQGFDLQVLRGAGDRIAEVAGIVTEVPVNRIYEGMPTMLEVLELVDRLGFQLSGLFPVTRDRRGVRLIEANCTFVRPELLGPDDLG